MKKKLLYINKHRIDKEMLELGRIQSYANDLYRNLCGFGIKNPEAIKNPGDALIDKLKDSIPSNGVEIPLKNIIKLLNKEKEYKSVMELSNKVSFHRLLDLLEFNGNIFVIKQTARKNITERMTPYLTDQNEIMFIERIEKMITEANSISEILGINLSNTEFLRTFRAYRVNGEFLISPGDFISRFNNYSGAK